MNKMLWYLINLRWNLIKYTGLTGLSGSIFSLVDITGLTGFNYFRKMMSYVFRGTMMS